MHYTTMFLPGLAGSFNPWSVYLAGGACVLGASAYAWLLWHPAGQPGGVGGSGVAVGDPVEDQRGDLVGHLPG
jgi:hypothetical protein